MAGSKKAIAAGLKHSLCRISPRLYSQYLYRRITGKRLDLKQPEGMNQKLMWLKLNRYGDNPLVARCADKYAVRDYVRECGLDSILIELYGVWERAEDIPWEALPDKFVLKCNHGCGYNLFCADKQSFDTRAAAAQLTEWLQRDYWLEWGETQYRTIPRRIVCERMMGDGIHLPYDYKIYCFHGKPRYIMVCEERERGKPRFYFVDTEWNFCPITHDGLEAPEGFTVQKPGTLEQMLAAAEKLSAPFEFVRVDLYEYGEKVLFGELTFTPSACLDMNRLPETEKLFGEMIELS